MTPGGRSRYDRDAVELAARYEGVNAAAVHAPLVTMLAGGADRIALDVGAGSGRDSAWLASLGYDVIAVEPSVAMRAEGQRFHPGNDIRWLDDRLPELSNTHRLGLSFDLILVSAVWQHVPPNDRARAFRKLVTLLKPGGALYITLRHGPTNLDDSMHPVSLGEIEGLALEQGIAVIRVEEHPDDLGRDDVRWTSICLKLPDDGAGALPLLRGIILNDDKSSSYKLALLRAIARAADMTPALAIPLLGADSVELPLGLIALNWVRLYLPLVAAGLPQLPGNSGPDRLGFAKEGFRTLLRLQVAGQDLRVGHTFTGDRASGVARAISDAAATIVKMPATFTRFSNSDEPVFRATRARAIRAAENLNLDAAFLRSFGTIRVPGNVWRAMQRLGSWIEPVLVAEWARLIHRYADRMGLVVPPGHPETLLIWQEPKRDTSLARLMAVRVFARGEQVHCVWSGKALQPAQIDIDHCLPWSAWACGDLWNLMPSDRSINQHSKREKLPSAGTLKQAKPQIVSWWERGWMTDAALMARFEREVAATLPVGVGAGPDEIFTALEWRRLRLRQDQQVPEWAGVAR